MRFRDDVLLPYLKARAFHDPDTVGDDKKDYRTLYDNLDSDDTRRILFDSTQAILFGDLAEGPPDNIQRKLEVPFPKFYLELTHPINFGEQEADNIHDGLRSLTFIEDRGYITVTVGEDKERLRLSHISFFLTSHTEGVDHANMTDRSFYMHVPSGRPITRLHSIRTSTDPSETPDHLPDDMFIVAGDSLDMDNRYIGWWERVITQYTELFSYMLSYMMAKSIKIEPWYPSRQQRRLFVRKGWPVPYHIVVVDPQIVADRERAGGDVRSHHSFRYDVIGHLRFGRYARKDGAFTTTIEWIDTHQRGLANETYIPKTSKFKGGKVPAKQVQEYFKE